MALLSEITLSWLLVLAGTVFTGLLTLSGAVYAASRPGVGAAVMKDALAALTETVSVLQVENKRLRERIAQFEAELTTLHASFEAYKTDSIERIAALYARIGRAQKE